MKRSAELLERALKVIPGGVSSPVRAFRGVGGDPIFIESAVGAYVRDVDGKQYIDYVGSWGPAILGHAPEELLETLEEVCSHGLSFGAPTEVEVDLAELITEIIPSIEMVRFVSSGTEATMSALRLARGFTGRKYIIKCNGCYHGHADTLLVAAGSGVATLGIAGSPGVPDEIAQLTMSVEFNNLEQMHAAVELVGGEQVAAIIIEPVAGNMGLVLPEDGYLQGLRNLCDKFGIVLIFDEVMTGFRVALGGAQERFSVRPDLTTFGKVIGGGLPVGAFGGRADIMRHVAPIGPVYQAGTLSGNPLAMTAGLITLQTLVRDNPYPALEELASRLSSGLKRAADKAGIPFVSSHIGSMFGFFFTDRTVKNYSEAKQTNQPHFQKFFHSMLHRGIYLAPSAFEAGFLSVAHTPALIDQTLQAAGESFLEIT